MKKIFSKDAILYILCLVLFLEAVAFYNLRINLALYLEASLHRGGLGWSKQEALSFSGWYFACLHMFPLIGGWVSDRWLGAVKSITWGLGILSMSYYLIICASEKYLFMGLGCVVLGYGIFKPSLSALVGSIYSKNDRLRYKGFSVLYLISCFSIFFGSAFSGIILKYSSYKFLFVCSSVLALSSLFLFYFFGKQAISLKEYPSSAVQQYTKQPLMPNEVSGIKFLFVLASFSIFFFAAHNEGGNLMTLYIKDHVDLYLGRFEIPVQWVTSYGSLITICMTAGGVWVQSILDKKGINISPITILQIGIWATALSFLIMTCAELLRIQDLIGEKIPLLWVLGFQVTFLFSKACVNPLIWSLASKHAPKAYKNMAMGGVSICIGLGHALGGWFNSFFYVLDYLGLFCLTAMLLFATSAYLKFMSLPLLDLMKKAR